LTLRSAGPDQTRALGEAIGSIARLGDVLALAGDLGAGKTTFVRGLARSLGVTDDVTSPTFVLMKQYQGRLPLVHVDLYRMNRVQELLDLGFDELLDGSAIVVIEWGDMVEDLLPPDHIEVRLMIGESSERVVELVPHGPAWAERSRDLFHATKAWT
jgi:tRNA threonylcarbamoyladenosine biosynthesis protein TsaE